MNLKKIESEPGRESYSIDWFFWCNNVSCILGVLLWDCLDLTEGPLKIMLLLTFIGRDGSRHSFSKRYLGIWFRKAIGTTDLMSCAHICRNWLATLEYATYNILDVYYKLHTLMWPRGVTLIPSDRDRYATRSKPGLYGSEATFLHIPCLKSTHNN